VLCCPEVASAGGAKLTPLLNPFSATFVTLRTRLSSQECFGRLREATEPWISRILVIPFLTSRRPLWGWVYPAWFAVRRRVPGDFMQPEARANFVAAPDGTRMAVRLGYPRWLAILDVFNLAYIALYLVGMGFLCRHMKLQHCDRMFLFAIAFPLFLAIAPLLFPRRFREDSESLLAFLKQTLEAEEVPPRSLAT
jgi:hypothetical protein